MAKKIVFGVAVVSYLFLCVGVFYLAEIARDAGILCAYSDLLGAWIVPIGYLAAGIVLIAPLVLYVLAKPKDKKKFLIQSVFALLLVCVIGIVSWNSLESFYHEFTPEKWEQYPSERWLMSESLETQMIGKSLDEVETLLGKPDDISGNQEDFIIYWYHNGMHGEIRIYFRNGLVSEVGL